MVAAKFWMERRVLATGLLVSWLAKAFVELGANVVTIVRDLRQSSGFLQSGVYRNVSIVNGELEDFRVIERAIDEHAVNTVFHLGAQATVGVARRSPLATFEANIRGTYNLLEACRLHSRLINAVVVASSDKAYGESLTLKLAVRCLT
ncbi:MAG: hypothetical protein C0473_02375 [Cyanobacteria bacterium DS3.002]|nr:hypothetical protein [Cyanobacteria bacterium DS3.002]MBA4049659.1 hypothetical protein [Cyanobacteria bacterium DS2.008]